MGVRLALWRKSTQDGTSVAGAEYVRGRQQEMKLTVGVELIITHSLDHDKVSGSYSK